MCRSWKKVQHNERENHHRQKKTMGTTIQKIKGKDHKAFYDLTLLLNERPIKFIIDSGSPVTLIPNCPFNKLTKVEPLTTTYKDVNNQKIEFNGQTKTMVKTNQETLKLPLLITRKTTTSLLGLDWMQRLGIHLNTNNSEIQIHNIQPGGIKEKTADLKNEFKDLFYNNNEMKDLSVKLNLKEGSQIIQQKGKPILIHLKDQVARELKRLIEKGYLERATEIIEGCFVSPAVITVKKNQ